ncbi:MAG: PaaI family thioesterase [Pseudomonadota bacterium]
MSNAEAETIPEGYEPLPDNIGFTDNLAPCYRRIDQDSVSFGLFVQEQHCNLLGICHGGALATLADVAGGSSVNLARGVLAGSPTISLNLDYVAAARLGEWIQSETQQVTVKRRFAFCSGLIRGDRGIVVRFNGTFYIPDHDGMWQEGRTPDGLLGE